VITYDKKEEEGRMESRVTSDEFSRKGEGYIIKVVAIPPYKDYANGKDELLVNLYYENVVTGKGGMFEKIWLDARDPNEKDGHLRRHSAYRTLERLLAAQEKIVR